MKYLIRLAAKMYPGPWRERYGQEFEALLDDAGADGRIALDVFIGALLMRVQRWQKAGLGALPVVAALFAAAWWAGQRPYITPGTHQIFRMDSTLGFLLEFLVLLSLVLAGLITWLAGQRRWVCAGIAAAYLGGMILVSLLTPRTIVSIGDSYCWDLWCLGIQNVSTAPQGQDVLYRAELSLSVDSTTAQLELTDQTKEQGKQIFYVTDQQGRHFPILAFGSAGDGNVTVKPGEPVRSSLSFLAPANARNLYLTGDIEAPFWVRLYFGSDLNPFHRRTLLRVV